MVHNAVDVELVKERVAVLWLLAWTFSTRDRQTYFRNRRGEHNDLVQLADPLHKLVDAGTLDNVYIVVLALDLDRDGEIGLVQYLWILVGDMNVMSCSSSP